MSRAAESVRLIGQLERGGPWIGFTPTPDGYRLVFGAPDGSFRVERTDDPGEQRAGLVAAAIAFFLSSLSDPPAELEATQLDIARLVASLDMDGAAQEALDAIDDGLPADAVALCLQRLLPAGVDALTILRARARWPEAEG
jgi:hypothetical protein